MNNDRFKYRVWDGNKKKFISPKVFINYHGELCDMVHRWFYPGHENCIIEQCTGFCDLGGHLIYEGDVVKSTAGWCFNVIWNGGAWFAENETDFPLLERLSIMPLGLCKIVGNIHEATK